MIYKCHFRNEVSKKLSEILGFPPELSWFPTKGHASLETFLNQLEK